MDTGADTTQMDKCTPDPAITPEQKEAAVRKRKRWIFLAGICLIIVAVYIVPPIYGWQRMSEQRALALSNCRRVAQATLLYAQDWDSCTMPPPTMLADQSWLTWPTNLKQYITPDSTYSNPANPVVPFHSSLRDPNNEYPINSSFAINRRLWNTFGKGPFPLDNLEMPEGTLLFIEAGRMWRNPYRAAMGKNIAFIEYGDTTDKYNLLCPYPSSHDSKMVVVAADGHGVLITVQHYASKDGPHDTLYGSLGAGIYNWNAGHPNGETDHPPRE